MTTATLSIARPDTVAVPRGALWVGWLIDLGASLRRSRQSTLALRDVERRARDAAAMRRWAMRLQDSEPNLAADLRAAADRHIDA